MALCNLIIFLKENKFKICKENHSLFCGKKSRNLLKAHIIIDIEYVDIVNGESLL